MIFTSVINDKSAIEVDYSTQSIKNLLLTSNYKFNYQIDLF